MYIILLLLSSPILFFTLPPLLSHSIGTLQDYLSTIEKHWLVHTGSGQDGQKQRSSTEPTVLPANEFKQKPNLDYKIRLEEGVARVWFPQGACGCTFIFDSVLQSVFMGANRVS
jgi:hypothetical protein